jgi:hypothetical protein
MHRVNTSKINHIPIPPKNKRLTTTVHISRCIKEAV